MDNVEKLLKIIAASMAVIIPCILLAGFSYHLGYSMSFGLSDALIPKSMSDVLVESWYVGVMSIAWLMSKLTYLLGFYLLCAGVGVTSFLYFLNLQKNSVTWVFDEISKENQGKTICKLTQWHWVLLADFLSYLLTWFFMPVLFLVILTAFTVLPFTEGKDSALKKIETFKKFGCMAEEKTFSCISLIDRSKYNTVIARGILVSANENKIAIFNNKLEIWPLLDNYIIKSDKHEKEKPTSDK